MNDTPRATEPAAETVNVIAQESHHLPTPEQRLEQSRQRLRGIFHPVSEPNNTEQQAVADSQSETTGQGNAAFELANSLFKQWWEQHPWRVALRGAGELTQKIASDTAQRHPLRLVAGAAITAALVTRLKPWRAISRGTLVRGVLLGTGAGVKAGGLLNARAVLHSAVDVLASNIRRARQRTNTTDKPER